MHNCRSRNQTGLDDVLAREAMRVLRLLASVFEAAKGNLALIRAGLLQGLLLTSRSKTPDSCVSLCDDGETNRKAQDDIQKTPVQREL